MLPYANSNLRRCTARACPVYAMPAFLFEKKQKCREKRQLLRQLRQARQENQLTLTCQETFNNLVFGLNSTCREMLVVGKRNDGSFTATIIDLNVVLQCVVKKGIQEFSTKTDRRS